MDKFLNITILLPVDKGHATGKILAKIKTSQPRQREKRIQNTSELTLFDTS